jgi:hypothetical protein
MALSTFPEYVKRLTKMRLTVKSRPHAEVAELADALRSGRSELTLVRVQIPPSASFPFLAVSILQPVRGT